MARESNAPVEAATPRKNDQSHSSSSQHPEFGRPSPMGQPQRQQPSHHRPANPNLPFNIPKSNQSRPEHHRPANRSVPSYSAPRDGSANYQQRPAPNPGAAAGAGTATPSAKRPFDPFKPVRPSAYNDYRPAYNAGATPIKRPENVNFTTPRAPRPIFQSNAGRPKTSNASKNIQAFIDLTKNDEPHKPQDPYNSQPSLSGHGSTFGAMDAGGYVDSEKANENIKALLEGAFEDEEDEQPRKSKNKKKDKKKKQSKKAKSADNLESAEPAKTKKESSSDDLDDLAAQLGGVTVNDVKNEEHDTEELGTSKETSESNKASKGDAADLEIEDTDAKAESEEDEGEPEDEDEEDEEEDDGIVEGLKVNLLPHQVDGVKWMCNKETGQRTTKGIYPKGGILADDMGLGKTVQAIALMLRNNKSEYEHSEKFDSAESKKDDNAPPASKLSKSTLVVAPLALIKQWESEILDKVEKTHRLRVCLYHGTNRAKTATSLDDYDVVITTYGTLTSESGTAAADKAKKSGIFSVYWYRIILDEAHTIKNRNAKATQAAYSLDAKFRWCLTGTPMQNNLDELQSLIRFLRIKPYDELAAWRDQISRPLNNGRGGLAIQRLQIYLKAFMKRRTKDVLKNDDNMKAGNDGKDKKSNGFQIVKREVIRVDGEFMEGELNFYNRLEKRTENRLEQMMGEKLDYAGALVLLLRLRQACNHPDLVKSDLVQDKDVLLQNGNNNSQSKGTKQDDLDDVANLFGALSVVTKKCDVCQAGLSEEEAKSGASRCHECEANVNTDFMKKAKEDKPKKKKVHRHHKKTVSESDSQAFRPRKNKRVILDSDDEEEAEWIVPEEERSMPKLGKAGGSDDENAEGGGDWIGSSDSETDDDVDSPTRKKSQPLLPSESEFESESETESESDENIYENPTGTNGELPSTKIRHLMKILNKESADYKFIVFSVFTSMLDKVEPFLNRANIGFARYDGGMRNDLREASLNKLRNNSGTRVLLCSLRAGALGLNLTAASRVVIMEPFWNPVCFKFTIKRGGILLTPDTSNLVRGRTSHRSCSPTQSNG